MLLKRNFRRCASTGSRTAMTRAFEANVPHSPLASRVIGYFTAHAISGFEARSFDTRHWNDQPITENLGLVRIRRSGREKSDNELIRERSKRSGVRMIAIRARSKAKALLPSGWFRRNGKTADADTCITSRLSPWLCCQRRARCPCRSGIAVSIWSQGTQPMPRPSCSSVRT